MNQLVVAGYDDVPDAIKVLPGLATQLNDC